MNSSWEYGTLADAVDKASSNVSLNKIKDDDGGYPVFGAKGFAKNVSFYQQEQEYLAIIKDGSGIGRVTKHPQKSSILATMQYLLPRDGFDIGFIKYFLNGIDFEKYRTGAAIPHIYFKDYKDEQFPILTITEQQRIVSTLDEAFKSIDQAIANTEKNLANARELFESYLNNVFTQKGEGWVEVNLGEKIELLTGFAFKSKQYTDDKDGIKLLRGDNVIQGSLRWKDAKKWSSLDTDSYIQYYLNKHDIVLAMDRTWIKAGIKYAQIDIDDLPCLLVQRVARLRVKDELDSTFLKFLIGSKLFERYVLSIQTGLGVPHISGSQIKAFTFSMPTIELQREISITAAQIHEQVNLLKDIHENKLASLVELKQSILQKAFSGELTSEDIKQQVSG